MKRPELKSMDEIIENFMRMEKDFQESNKIYNKFVGKQAHEIARLQESDNPEIKNLADSCYMLSNHYILLCEMVEYLKINYMEQLSMERMLKAYIDSKGLTKEAINFVNQLEDAITKKSVKGKKEVTDIKNIRERINK